MMKWKWRASLLIILFLTACGTASTQPKADGGQLKSQSQNPENSSGWETVEVVNNRSIIAKLEQTTNDTSKRDRAVEEVKDLTEFLAGQFGDTIEERVESLAVEVIEGGIVESSIADINGGYDAFMKKGVIFFVKEVTDTEPFSVWIGVKQADEKLKSFVDALQEKVDSGDMLAKNIHIYYTPYTTEENHLLTDEVYKVVNEIVKQSATPEHLLYVLGVDAKTGAIEIRHNFLTEEQQQLLRDQFSERNIVFDKGNIYPSVEYSASAI